MEDLLSDDLQAKRMKVTTACDACRRRKVKCDAIQPCCTNCQAAHVECIYSGAGAKRGPPKGYVAVIEDRLHSIETLLGELVVQGKDKVDRGFSHRLAKDEILDEEKPIINRPPFARHNSRTTPDHEPSPHLSQSPLSISSPISDACRLGNEGMDLDVLDVAEAGWEPPTHSSKSTLFVEEDVVQNTHPPPVISNMATQPSPDLAGHLIELYFRHHYPHFPILHRQTFLAQLQDPTQPISALLLNAIYAIAARYSNDPALHAAAQRREHLGMAYFDQATQMLDRFMDAPRITTVQALVLMAIYEAGLSQFTRPSVLVGMATKMAQLLGLQRKFDLAAVAPREAELRKRTFWGVYLLDRLIGSVLGQPLTILDKDCDVELPSLDAAEGEPDDDERVITLNLVHMIKLNRILGDVLQHVYSPALTLPRFHTAMLSVFESSLTAWASQLPPHLELAISTSTSTSPQIPTSSFAGHLHLLYHEALILLHRPFLQFPNRKALLAMATSLRVCTNAANSITHIAESILTMNTDNCVTFPFTSYSIALASTIHCLNLNSKNDSLSGPAKANLMTTIKLYKLFLRSGMLSQSAARGVQNIDRLLWNITPKNSAPSSPKLSTSAPSPSNRVRRLVSRFETSPSESTDSPDTHTESTPPHELGLGPEYWTQHQPASGSTSPTVSISPPRPQVPDRPPSRCCTSPRMFNIPMQQAQERHHDAFVAGGPGMARSSNPGSMIALQQQGTLPDGDFDPQFWNEFGIDWEALDRTMTRTNTHTTTGWPHHAHDPPQQQHHMHFTPQPQLTTEPASMLPPFVPLFTQPGYIATGVSNMSTRSSASQPPPYPNSAPNTMGVAVTQALQAPPKPPRTGSPPPALAGYGGGGTRFSASAFTRKGSSNSSYGKVEESKVGAATNAINFVMGKKRRDDLSSMKKMTLDEFAAMGSGGPAVVKFDAKNVKFMNLKFPPKVNQGNMYWKFAQCERRRGCFSSKLDLTEFKLGAPIGLDLGVEPLYKVRLRIPLFPAK
ncbi:hypothetical protein BC938DRAFT_472736, partial [Jimgerdemannia flammicorona]